MVQKSVHQSRLCHACLFYDYVKILISLVWKTIFSSSMNNPVDLSDMKSHQDSRYTYSASICSLASLSCKHFANNASRRVHDVMI